MDEVERRLVELSRQGQSVVLPANLVREACNALQDLGGTGPEIAVDIYAAIAALREPDLPIKGGLTIPASSKAVSGSVVIRKGEGEKNG